MLRYRKRLLYKRTLTFATQTAGMESRPLYQHNATSVEGKQKAPPLLFITQKILTNSTAVYRQSFPVFRMLWSKNNGLPNYI